MIQSSVEKFAEDFFMGLKDVGAVGARRKGLSNSPLYNVWKNIIDRCFNVKCQSYLIYGGRGITVCERWMSFDNFHDDNIQLYDYGLEIDRVDNDNGYYPENIRWTTRKENCNNRSTTKKIIYDGLELSITQHAERLGVNPKMVIERLANGWGVERALTEGKGENTVRAKRGEVRRKKLEERARKHNAKLKRYRLDGKDYTISELSAISGVTTKLLRKRIDERGWSVERAVSTK